MNWLGVYDECVKIEAVATVDNVTTSPFSGRYCSVGISNPNASSSGQVPPLGVNTVQLLTIGCQII